MKFTRKLIPALAMLIVSATMMSTASFAWFSMNSQVSATGMSVTASAPANLHIGNDFIAENACTATEITMSSSNKTLAPTMLSFATNKLSANEPDKDNWTTKPTPGTAGEAGSYNEVGALTGSKAGEKANVAESGTITSSIAYEKMTIVRKNANNGQYDLSAVVTVENIDTTTPVDIWKALKVGFLLSTDQGENWTWIQTADEDATLTGTTAKFSSMNLGVDFADNNTVSVVFVVWYDGDDDDCFANNALVTNALTIRVDFNSIDS